MTSPVPSFRVDVSQFTSLVRRVIWAFAKGLALRIMLATTVALSCALLFWHWAIWHDAVSPSISLAARGALLACYFAAGIVWAVHRSYDQTIEVMSPLLLSHGPNLLGAVLDPLWAQSSRSHHQLAVVDARSMLQDFLANKRFPDRDTTAGRGIIYKVTRLVLRRVLRKELEMADDALRISEQQGETYVSTASLKEHLSARIVTRVMEVAQSRARRFGLACAIVVFLLVLTPSVLIQLSL